LLCHGLQVKRALNSPPAYEDFLRCLNLYSHDIVNLGELVQLVSNFIAYVSVCGVIPAAPLASVSFVAQPTLIS
jgi:hypothetical protein